MGYYKLLFNAGIVITLCTLLAIIICFFHFKVRAARLKAQLDEEYGEQKRETGRPGKTARM